MAHPSTGNDTPDTVIPGPENPTTPGDLPVLESGVVIQIQLMQQATGVWVHLQTAAYSAGVR